MVGKYFAQDIFLIAMLTNLHGETDQREELVNLSIQRNSYNFLNFFSRNLRKTKNFFFSNMIRIFFTRG
jgi:hypothetical protein